MILEDGIFLQTMDTWKDFILAEDITAGNAAELYFEEENMDAFCRHLESSYITYVHDLHEHAWGQHVIRFYDPADISLRWVNRCVQLSCALCTADCQRNRQRSGWMCRKRISVH